jgi:hydroxypyruvate reductase
LEDVQAAACRLVDFARIVDSGLQGQAREVGRRIGDFLAEEAERRDRTGRHCFLWGGEPSVTVAGSGKGGPTQELALAAGEQLAAKEPSTASVAVGALATDGIDGPTDAAGAIVGSNAISAGRRKGLDPREILENNDTYRFLDAVDSLVRIGPTETNVNDVVVGIVDYD